MAESIELTPLQAAAVAVAAETHGPVIVRQLAGVDAHTPGDVYLTAIGTSAGLRITPAGEVTDIGETLPATPAG